MNAQRNDPCPCGSGKKYKKCCLGKAASASAPPPIAAWLHTASQYHQTGRLAEAEALYRDVLAQAPDHPQALHRLGILAYQLGHLETAQALVSRAIEVDGTDASQHNDLGQIYQARGRLAEAAACYQQVIRTRPGGPVFNNLGIVYFDQGKYDEAVSCFLQAQAIDPRLAEPYNNLGNTYIKLRHYAAAIPYLQQAVKVKPAYAEAHNHLGIAYFELGELEKAATCHQKALSLNPDFAEALTNLGNIIVNQDRVDEAVRLYQKALHLKPDLAMAHLNLGVALFSQGRTEDAVPRVLQALTLQGDLALAYDSWLFTLNYLASTRPAAVVSACRRYAEQFEAPLRPSWPMHTNSRDPERRLKVGYVSADFRLHSVAYFMEPLLAHHDRDAVEVYGYYNNTREDAVTARLQARVDHWLPCKGMADEELAARIQADGIDILVDLAGHTAGNRLLVFARKPAPVQVTYLGYPATTGLSAIDYRLVTADTDPPGAEAWHSERLYRLPRSLWCYRPAPDDAGRHRRHHSGAAQRLHHLRFDEQYRQGLRSHAGGVVKHPAGHARGAAGIDQLTPRRSPRGARAALCGARHRRRAAYPARQAAGGGVLRAAEHHRHRAGPVSVHGHHHHLRESVDGGAGGDADRRDERGALGVCVAQGHWIGRTGGGR